jgi:hypothetical protein
MAIVWTDGDARSADESYVPSDSCAHNDSRTDGDIGDRTNSDGVLSVVASRMCVGTCCIDSVTLLIDGVHSVVAPRLDVGATDVGEGGAGRAGVGTEGVGTEGVGAAGVGAAGVGVTDVGVTDVGPMDVGPMDDSSEGSSEATGIGRTIGSGASISEGILRRLWVSARSAHLQCAVWYSVPRSVIHTSTVTKSVAQSVAVE